MSVRDRSRLPVAGAAISMATAAAILVRAERAVHGRGTRGLRFGGGAGRGGAGRARSRSLPSAGDLRRRFKRSRPWAFVLVFVVFGWPGLEASGVDEDARAALGGGWTGAASSPARTASPTSASISTLGRALARESDAGGLARRVLDAIREDCGSCARTRSKRLAAREPLTIVRVMTVSRRAVVRLSPPGPDDGRKDGM